MGFKNSFNSRLKYGSTVANYTFNGNANDASGKEHNGIVNDGPAAYVTGRKGDTNGALFF
jgi:hypothetical protein